jgi:release factor glutamine methyltransferase
MTKKTTIPQMFHCNGLTIELHSKVYEPAEDTYLLLQTIDVHPDETVLEIGTGTGIIALDCARKGARVVCSDINPYAVRLARHNIAINQRFLTGSIEVRQGDLFSVVHSSEHFEAVVFNPPYLPTSHRQRTSWNEIAVDGGKDGLQQTKRFIHGLKKHLTVNGKAYFIFSSLSKKTMLEDYIKRERFRFQVTASCSFEGEQLDVYCVTPTD